MKYIIIILLLASFEINEARDRISITPYFGRKLNEIFEKITKKINDEKMKKIKQLEYGNVN